MNKAEETRRLKAAGFRHYTSFYASTLHRCAESDIFGVMIGVRYGGSPHDKKARWNAADRLVAACERYARAASKGR